MKNIVRLLVVAFCAIPVATMAQDSHDYVTIYVSDYQTFSDLSRSMGKDSDHHEYNVQGDGKPLHWALGEHHGDEASHEGIPAVPEPESAWMLLAGLALIGYAFRRSNPSRSAG